MQMKGTFDSALPSRGYDDEKEREQDRIRQAPLHAMSRPAQRTRGHTYSSSLSSDYGRNNGVPETPSSKYSSPPHRSRRSNSSTNFATMTPPAGGRTSTMIPTSKFSEHKRTRTSSDTQRKTKAGEKPARPQNHSRVDSDNSVASVSYSAILESSRLAWGGARSISMDQIYAGGKSSDSMMERGRPVPSVYSKFDSPAEAAPEPMVPAGPRKMQNPAATGPVYVNQASKNSSLRKITTQSDLRSASNPTIPQDVRDRASEFVRANSMRGDAVPPATGDRSAQGSISGPARRKDTHSPQRERPGFFKRVFGGSRSAERTDLVNQSTESPSGRKPSATGNGAGSHLRNEYQHSREQSPATSSHPPAALNKKPSSFFRRRKRSMSEAAPPPPIPLSVGNLNPPAVQSPSASSLRKVMGPYIGDQPYAADAGDDSRPVTSQSHEDSDELSIFHSGYTPPPDASLGRRNPLSREPSSRNQDKENESPKVKLKVKKQKPDPIPVINASRPSGSSFLRDDSTERAAPVSPVTFYSPMDTANTRVSPVSTAAPSIKESKRSVSPVSFRDQSEATDATSPAEPSPNQDMRDFAAGHNVSLDMHDQSWLVTHDTQRAAHEPPITDPAPRLYLQPSESKEEKEKNNDGAAPSSGSHQNSRSASMNAPSVAAAVSPVTPSTRYHSATSLPLVQVDGNEAPRPSVDTLGARPSPRNEEDVYKERAKRIYEGDEEDVTRMEAAAWLGETKTLNKRTLDAYMQLFDLAGMNILAALRTLCGKLVLKGETQQFDRIITALSFRWCQCNPNHGFKAQDVVHTICYSIILLNTDLHMAEIGEKMSKNAYVKNTLPTVRRVVADAAPNAFDETIRATPSQARPSLPWSDPSVSGPNSPGLPPDTPQERTSFDVVRPAMTKRMSMRPAVFRTDSEGGTSDSPNSSSSMALVSQPWTGTMRAWEDQIETVLKTFYTSIRTEPLPLLNLSTADVQTPQANLTVHSLKRSGSVASRAPSEAVSYRSKQGLRSLATMGWQGRSNRSRPKLYPASTVGSSRTSFDDDSSIWSPAQSSTWSRYSNGKALTSTSVGSLGYHMMPPETAFKHSIGFANALSQAIIREEGGATATTNDTDSMTIRGDLLEDESLALEGAPWAKEGLVKHKHHLEGPERKSKARHWGECFAVITKGRLTLFNFNTDSKSRSLGRQKLQKGSGRAPSIASQRVGGGDWTENAEQIDSFVLRQTIASVLPPPGYSKARPHVWALSLPSGAVHLFHVGTPEIAAEWMSTANYWSARLSKEPLSGGVSNIEYGWSDQVINPALVERAASPQSFSTPPVALYNRQRTHTHSSSSGGNLPRPSTQSSLRSSFDIGGGSRSRMPGDKIQISDWQQPSQSMMASQLMEVDQLKALTTYVSNVETELDTHNKLKDAIELAVSHSYLLLSVAKK